MTTPAAAALYEAQHVFAHEGLKNRVFNPKLLPVEQLPVIYGFNNGGSYGYMHAQLIAQDGVTLGSHLCTSEPYMPSDLGILEGTGGSNREFAFDAHYPDGYRCEFVSYKDVPKNAGLQAAFAANKLLANQEKEVSPA